MRLDKYLKVSRIIKRRTVANEACDAGRIEVNGKVQRASYDVKIGDRIAVNMGAVPRVYEVLEISEHALKEDASKMYKPKPTRATFSPSLRASVTASITALTAASASFFESSALVATAATSSVLFI